MGMYYSSYHMYETMATMTVIAFIAALVCAILCFILVTPEKRRKSLNKFFAVVADVFNFKQLLLEKILKFIYIFFTLYLIFLGFFYLFMNFLAGLLIIVLGPIFVRVIFELFMMTILLVKNVIEINKKLGKSAEATEPSPFDVSYDLASAKSAPAAADTCSVCGAEVNLADSSFCSNCGTKLN